MAAICIPVSIGARWKGRPSSSSARGAISGKRSSACSSSACASSRSIATPTRPRFADATVGEAVDFQDLDAVTEVGRRHGVDGVLTVSADRAVPIVAAIAERLGLPGIGSDAARKVTHKVAMRRALGDAGVPQPRFAALRNVAEAHAAAATVGFPAVLKAADSAGQRGLFRVDLADAARPRAAPRARGVDAPRGDPRELPSAATR